MGFAQTARILLERRRLVAAGVAVAFLAALLSVCRIGLLPPSLESRTNVFATASTQILVDTPGSAFADLRTDLEPLNARAGVYARFLASPTAISLIAREAGLPADAIEAQGPYDLNVPRFQVEPTAEQRSSQIVGERALYRLRFESTPELPIVTVFAQAPGEDEAIALAAAVPSALRAYIGRLEMERRTAPARRVAIRRLGSADGGTVNGDAAVQIATLVFLTVLVGWCLLSVVVERTARGRRRPGGLIAANGARVPGGGRGGRRRGGAEVHWPDSRERLR